VRGLKQLLFNDRQYHVTEDTEKVTLKDQSKQQIKVNFSFSKNPDKNKKAKDGLTIFFTEIFS
jgi:hypothetical protein